MSKTSPPALVVGTGHGRRVHLPALRAAGFDVVGLVGADPARTKKYADANNIAHAFTDLDEAIAKTGAVAVTIATPPHTHAPLAMIALARGCHVLCEKPFAKDSDEARRVLDAAARTGTFCIMGNQFRMLPERLVIAQAIDVVGFASLRLTAAINERWPEAQQADVELLSDNLVRLAISYAAFPAGAFRDVPAEVRTLLGPFVAQALGR